MSKYINFISKGHRYTNHDNKKYQVYKYTIVSYEILIVDHRISIWFTINALLVL